MIRSRLTYANVMSSIAVFAVLGGGAYAAQKIGAKDIRKNAVRSKHIKNRGVKPRDLSGKARKRLQGERGPAGPRGAQGPQGAQGPPGGGGPPSGPAGGDLAGTYPNPAIATGAVDSAKVANGSLLAGDIAPNQINTVHILNGQVAGPDLANGAVSAAKLGNVGVTIENRTFPANLAVSRDLSCPAGGVLLSGGLTPTIAPSLEGLVILTSFPLNETTWRVAVDNPTGSAVTRSMRVLCLEQ